MPLHSTVQWQIVDGHGRRKYLSAGERARFIAASDREVPVVRALCHTLAHSGCRISEALELTAERVDVELGTLTLRTLKRRRCGVFRTVPVPASLIAMLHCLPPDSGGRLLPMHRVTAWRHVKRVMETLELDGPRACCRGLRHGYAILAAGHNVPPNLIQRWMGHASPTTTAIYLDAVGQEERCFASRLWLSDGFSQS